MGLKIADLVPKKEVSWADLANKKIAVDASQMLYQFASSIRQRDGTPLMDSQSRITSHLVGIFSRVSNLMKKNIKLCFIFDGKPPVLKIKEQEERAFRKRVATEKLEKAKEDEDYDAMQKYSRQTVRLTRDMVDESKELLKYMGMPVIQAPSEAEAQASYMCKQGDVWAVASSDYDCLIYKTPRLLTNLTLSTRKRLPSGTYVSVHPEMIELDDVLNHLGIEQDQLLAIAILTGTDYNIGGVKGVGPKNALKLVKEFKSFDKIFKEVKADFNWKQIYAVFKSMPVMINYQLKWGSPDDDKIKELLIEKHDFSEERVNKVLDSLNKYKKDKNQKGLSDFFGKKR
ncbi:MAG: flap endonuclease-1 [Nanoarchaeota archaeon]|nr:flap endonuclease-1 [Nanoarchaeota archaeon]MCG2718227.1 flap endonuclease-1 [Nanoarchaeota archaeon]